MSNPFEPGAARPVPPPPAQSPPGDWTIGEALNVGWWGLKSWPIQVLGSLFVMFGVVMTFVLAPMAYVVLGLGVSPLSPAFQGTFQMYTLPGTLISMLVSPYIEAGVTRLFLTVVRHGEPSFGELFSGGDVWARLFGLRLLVGGPFVLVQFLPLALSQAGLPTWPGTLAMYTVSAVFTIAMALGLMFASVFVVDQGLGPIAGLTTSWRATEGQRGKLFLFCVAAFAVMMAAECLCLLPMIAAVPVVYLAAAWVYTRLASSNGVATTTT